MTGYSCSDYINAVIELLIEYVKKSKRECRNWIWGSKELLTKSILMRRRKGVLDERRYQTE